jgi:regulator of ribonuclease activity A
MLAHEQSALVLPNGYSIAHKGRRLADRRKTTVKINTAVLFDRYNASVEVCETQFRDFGMRRAFCGRCQTLRIFENHVPLRDVLATKVDGEVLVVDAGGSLRVGVLGDKIAALGFENGWVGIVVFGAIRDATAVGQINIGVKALGTTARRGYHNTEGIRGAPLQFGSARFETGDWVYADSDSILVSKSPLDIGGSD